MPRYAYIARSQAGDRVEGAVEAQDRRAALVQIERLGHTPISVREGLGATAPAARGAKKRFSLERRSGRRLRMGMSDVLLLTRELSDLLSSGMTLGNALHTLSKRSVNPAQDAVVKELRDEVVQGTSLSDALATYPDTFSSLYVSLVRAGEASGQMAEVLQRLSTYFEMVKETREKVISALIYPVIVLTMGIGTMIFTMIFVVPRFSAIFAELNSTLPLPTQILIGVSSTLMNYGWIIALVIFLAVFLFRRAIRRPAGRRWWDGVKLRMPIMRRVTTANAFAQFARTLSSLLRNGVPVLQALSIVEHTVGNSVIAAEIREARDRVTDGSTISGPLAQGRVFPQLLTEMLAVGEETGDMAGSLEHIAKRYDSELDRSVKLFTTILEPILILVMAILVGFVAVSMLLAVFDLTSGLNV
jgi:type II secretory pathway component PulF